MSITESEILKKCRGPCLHGRLLTEELKTDRKVFNGPLDGSQKSDLSRTELQSLVRGKLIELRPFSGSSPCRFILIHLSISVLAKWLRRRSLCLLRDSLHADQLYSGNKLPFPGNLAGNYLLRTWKSLGTVLEQKLDRAQMSSRVES